MLGFLLSGLVVGFALGWGVYWYLQQEDRGTWTIPAFVLDQPISRELLERFGEKRPVVGGELFKRTQNIITRDEKAVQAAQQAGDQDDVHVATAPMLTAPPSDETLPPAAESDLNESDEDSSGSEDTSLAHDDDAVIAYCLTCQMRRPIRAAERTETRTGRIAVRGVCPECGSELFTFISSDS